MTKHCLLRTQADHLQSRWFIRFLAVGLVRFPIHPALTPVVSSVIPTVPATLHCPTRIVQDGQKMLRSNPTFHVNLFVLYPPR